MEVRLDGRVILVTGATQGVGESIATRVAGAGAEAIILTGRNAARGAAVAAALTGLGPRTLFVPADLAEADAPARIAAAALARFGRIDALVNAAGLTDRGPALAADPALWDRLFAVNARAPYYLMQAAIADMQARGAPGAIVNILSMNAHCGTPDLAVYSASKGALATLTKTAAQGCLAARIRVNGIMMGWTVTPGEHEMQARTLGKGDGWEAEVAATRPLKRLLSADEVARLTLYLLSDASGLQTGTLVDLEQRVVGAAC